MNWEIDLVQDQTEIEDLAAELEPEELGFIIQWWCSSPLTPEDEQIEIDDPAAKRQPTLDCVWEFEQTQERFKGLAKYRLQQMLKRLCASEHFYRIRLRASGRFIKTLYVPRVLPYSEASVFCAPELDAQWSGGANVPWYSTGEGQLHIRWISEGEKGHSDSDRRSWEVEVNGVIHAYEY